MSVVVKKALHVIIRIGLFELDRAYFDLPAVQRTKPCVRQTIDALHELEKANAAILNLTAESCPNWGPLEEPLLKLAPAWLTAPKGLGPDDVLDRWEERYVRR